MQHERAALVSLTCAQSRVCPSLLPSCSQQRRRRSDSWQLAAPRRTAARARRAKTKCERLYLGERDRRRDDGLGHRHRHLGRVHARRERANLERIRAGKEGNSNASLVQHFDSLCTEHTHDASGGDPRADGPEWPLRRRGMVGRASADLGHFARMYLLFLVSRRPRFFTREEIPFVHTCSWSR